MRGQRSSDDTRNRPRRGWNLEIDGEARTQRNDFDVSVHHYETIEGVSVT
jgi:hypothetical protein